MLIGIDQEKRRKKIRIIRNNNKRKMDKNNHRIIFKDSRNMSEINNKTIHLVITSPPYPMIEMWDESFKKMDKKTKELFNIFNKVKTEKEKEKSIDNIYDSMHNSLAKVWKECYRVLIDGGLLCINIGDATRKMNGLFRLLPNHARIIEICERIGFVSLPYIIWKKPTNKPNAFMGSGFLPPNAYVTLEVEYILIFRKGGLRRFEKHDKVRYKSAFTKDERDIWFSQIWKDIRGIRQDSNLMERRTGAFPDEIARRLIKMFSIKGDIVLDPFVGTGTTTIVAKELDRNSVSYEIDKKLKKVILSKAGLRQYGGKIIFYN